MNHVPFSVTRDDTTGTLVVAGDIEEAHLRELLEAVETDDDTVTVDLSAVTYLPSFVLGALAAATHEAAQRPGPPPFEITAAKDSIAASVLSVVAVPFRTTTPL